MVNLSDVNELSIKSVPGQVYIVIPLILEFLPLGTPSFRTLYTIQKKKKFISIKNTKTIKKEIPNGGSMA